MRDRPRVEPAQHPYRQRRAPVRMQRKEPFDLLTSQGMQANQQVTFFSDGGDTVCRLAEYLNPQAEQILDWFHLTMRITVLH